MVQALRRPRVLHRRRPPWSQRAPDFSLPSTEGRTVHLSDYLGKQVVLIDFWSTTCDPCMAEMPHLVELYKKNKDKGFVVLAVSLDGPESLAEVNRVVHDKGMVFPVLLDEETTVVARYNPKREMPFSVLIDKSGTIIEKKAGYTPGDEKTIVAEVGEKEPSSSIGPHAHPLPSRRRRLAAWCCPRCSRSEAATRTPAADNGQGDHEPGALPRVPGAGLSHVFHHADPGDGHPQLPVRGLRRRERAERHHAGHQLSATSTTRTRGDPTYAPASVAADDRIFPPRLALRRRHAQAEGAGASTSPPCGAAPAMKRRRTR